MFKNTGSFGDSCPNSFSSDAVQMCVVVRADNNTQQNVLAKMFACLPQQQMGSLCSHGEQLSSWHRDGGYRESVIRMHDLPRPFHILVRLWFYVKWAVSSHLMIWPAPIMQIEKDNSEGGE